MPSPYKYRWCNTLVQPFWERWGHSYAWDTEYCEIEGKKEILANRYPCMYRDTSGQGGWAWCDPSGCVLEPWAALGTAQPHVPTFAQQGSGSWWALGSDPQGSCSGCSWVSSWVCCSYLYPLFHPHKFYILIYATARCIVDVCPSSLLECDFLFSAVGCVLADKKLWLSYWFPTGFLPLHAWIS